MPAMMTARMPSTDDARSICTAAATIDNGAEITASSQQKRRSSSSISIKPQSQQQPRRRRNSTPHHSSSLNSTEDLQIASTLLDDDALQRKHRAVAFLRAVVIAVLIVATIVTSTLTFIYVRSSETSNFEEKYEDSVVKVAEGFQSGVNIKNWAAQTFSALYTSRYGTPLGTPQVWPNATMPDFQEQAAGQLELSNGRALSFNPIIHEFENRLQWEQHATESAWILGDDTLITPAPGTTFPANRTVAFGIYSRDVNGAVVRDDGYAPESRYPRVLVPVWQIAPIDTNAKAVMFNLHWERNRQRALDDMITYQVPALTSILQLVQDSELRPSSILFYPVFDIFDDKDTSSTQQRIVVGSISIVFSWDDVLARILPNYILGLVCVLESSEGQRYTYSISGDEVTLLGEGDLHDGRYSHMAHTVDAHLGRTEEILGNVDFLITYRLTIYPSETFESQYVTNQPAIFTTVVVLIFVCTAALFLLYDYLVEYRQKFVARAAERSGQIVDGLFPAGFRERLFKSHAQQEQQRRASQGGMAPPADSPAGDLNKRSSANKSYGLQSGMHKITLSADARIKKFMKKRRLADSGTAYYDVSANDPGPNFEEPIADLFLDSSIMFADIVGFTQWSSERAPSEVFHLLEALFWEFDGLASQYGVFKLGTIGDCYIAVTGIPDPMHDHALVLTQFAIECQKKVEKVCDRLSDRISGTERLGMRFGIHSGAVTAGILRGQKSRFELFGDTINTASRMESTGLNGRIQVSTETAELLRVEGRGHWLLKRTELVMAKGKGELQTYWIVPRDDEEAMKMFGHDAGDLEKEEASRSVNTVNGELVENVYESYYSREVEEREASTEENKLSPVKKDEKLVEVKPMLARPVKEEADPSCYNSAADDESPVVKRV